MRKKEHYLLLICFVLLILCMPMLTQAQGVKEEFIVAQFTFEPGVELKEVHNILANVPPENIIAMFEAVRC